MKSVSHKIVEKIETHFMFNNPPAPQIVQFVTLYALCLSCSELCACQECERLCWHNWSRFSCFLHCDRTNILYDSV